MIMITQYEKVEDCISAELAQHDLEIKKRFNECVRKLESMDLNEYDQKRLADLKKNSLYDRNSQDSR